MHAHARRFQLGALGLGGAVEKKLGRAVGGDERNAVAFENAEIGAVAQVIALPGIAVEQQMLDAGLAHRRREPLPPFLGECLSGLCHFVCPYSAASSCASCEAIVAPRRFGRDIAGAHIVGDGLVVARVARIAPAAAAGGEEGQPVARLHAHAGRLLELAARCRRGE